MSNLHFYGLGEYGSEPVIHSWCCELLSYNLFESIKYYGVAEDIRKPESQGVICHHSRFHKNAFLRRIYYFLLVIKSRRRRTLKSETNLVVYFPGCSILRVICPNAILYVPTFSVSRIKIYRFFFDAVLRIEAVFFRSVITVDGAIADKLHHRQTDIVPLGSRSFSDLDKDSSFIEFLYVGTLYNRDIPQLLLAIQIALSVNSKLRFTLIGRGCDHTANIVRSFIRHNHLDHNVLFLGEIHPPDVDEYFKRSHVGMSYVPQTEYFDLQPVTKISEYMAAGMFVLATKTTAQISCIDSETGTCVGACPEEYAAGILSVAEKINEIDSLVLQERAEKHLNSYLVKRNLLPLIMPK